MDNNRSQHQEPKITFGGWLDITMRAHGYTSDLSLARELGTHHSTIGRWRKGDAPDLPQLRKLAELFGTPLRRLIVLAGHASPEELEVTEAPTPEELDPIIRLIQNSPISDERKFKLLDEWYRRLKREQQIMKADVLKTDDREYLSYSTLEEAQRNMYAHHVLDIVKDQLDDVNDDEERKTRQ